MRVFCVVAIVLFALSVQLATAAPSLPITKAPVAPVPSLTGPPHDADAVQGQWFRRLQGPAALPSPNDPIENRTHEFYDNLPGLGGGSASYLAIKGVPANVVFDSTPGPTFNNILSFDIVATITNDVPGMGEYLPGNNSHNEHLPPLPPDRQYVGTLYQPKLTAEFAYGLNAPLPQQTGAPYFDMMPRIRAVNHDQLAWYCWTPGAQLPDPSVNAQPGDYYVPTWDFADIPIGQSATRLLRFVVDGVGLPPADLRWGAINGSVQNPNLDLLYNRTEDLKIGDWMDWLLVDSGLAYAGQPGHEESMMSRGGNVSVFHNVPEPSTLALLACLAVAAACVVGRRRLTA